MSEKRELFADIIVGIMTGDKDFVRDKLVLLDYILLDRLFQGSDWLYEICKEELYERESRDRASKLKSTL